MPCPANIQPIIAEIIRVGLLRIRASGWQGDSGQCAIEADHIHNLPSLLVEYRHEALKYYWDAERPAFISQCSNQSLGEFGNLWESLQQFVEVSTQTATSK